MKYIYSQSEGAGEIGNGLLKRWVGCVLGVVLFLSAAGSVAVAQSSSAMTQKQYLLWMANITGDRLGSSASEQDLINWARGKGMNPTGGWQLGAKLTKDAMAQTVVQLLNLAPRKGTFDAVRILEREGIFISSNNGFITLKIFHAWVDGFGRRVGNKPRGDDDDNGGGGGHGDDDDDDGDRDDDDGPRPTPTKPGHGHGDDNHDHSGPPGHGHGHGHGKPGKKGNH
jgi:hypothetical protein